MANDPVEKLIDEVHSIYSENSVHEVIDLDRESSVERLIYFYGPDIDMEKVTKYLAIVDRLRIEICDA
jgi:hypothetical protein